MLPKNGPSPVSKNRSPGRLSSADLTTFATVLEPTTPWALGAAATRDRRLQETNRLWPSPRWQNESTLRALLVDFYGTLVQDDDVVVARICRAVAAELGERVTAAEVARRWSGAFVAACEAAYGPHFRRQREVAGSSLESVLKTLGSTAEAGELLGAQFQYWQQPELFGDARRFLDGLSVPVCVVSNIDRADLEAAVAYHALEFDHAVTSEDVRAYKPRPEVFEQALKHLGVRSQEAVHVGDSLTADVGGAARAGLRTVWVNRGGRRRLSGPEPWAEVEGLHQLARMLVST